MTAAEDSRVQHARAILALEQQARAESRRRLPMLKVEIAAPCDVPWDSMHGDAKTRFCDTCTKVVHDLTAMTEPEIKAFLATTEGTTACVRVYQRKDGTVMREDCPFGIRRRRLRGVLLSGLSLAAVAFGCFTGLALLTSRPANALEHGHHASAPVSRSGLLTVLSSPNATIIIDGITTKNAAHVPVTPFEQHTVSVIDPSGGYQETQTVTLGAGELRTITLLPTRRIPVAGGIAPMPQHGKFAPNRF